MMEPLQLSSMALRITKLSQLNDRKKVNILEYGPFYDRSTPRLWRRPMWYFITLRTLKTMKLIVYDESYLKVHCGNCGGDGERYVQSFLPIAFVH